MDGYDAKSAGDAIESFIDQLSNWYVRRNRRRFWKSTDPEDKHSAYLTLYQCLDAAHRLMAPFVPFLSEHVYQNLVRGADEDAPLSVHMSQWPEANDACDHDQLLFDIGVVQKVVGLARAARGQSGVRTRQPLSRLLIRTPDDSSARALTEHQDQVLEELNVKSIEFIARDAAHVSYRIKPNLPRVGKRYGKDIPAIRTALEESDGADIAAAVAKGESYTITVPSGEITLEPEDLLIETNASEGFVCAEDAGFLVELDTTLDDALISEGIARELVRTVQDGRKQAGLQVSDRIVLGISGSEAVENALLRYRDYIMSETLATDWQVGQPDPLYAAGKALGEERWTIEIGRVG
jgi:isoleucyl-tRNA synthetase